MAGRGQADQGPRLILLPETGAICIIACAGPHILRGKRGSPKKCHLSAKKPLRTPAPIRKYPFTEAANNAAPEKQMETSRRARQVQRAQRSVLFLRSLKLLVSEEICGRFGSVRWINLLYIALVGFRSDDPVSASLFGRLSVSLKPKAQQTENCPFQPEGTMCKGSNVKDKRANAFQLESLILAQNERWRHA